jgi:hypothetical protein
MGLGRCFAEGELLPSFYGLAGNKATAAEQGEGIGAANFIVMLCTYLRV